MINPVHPVPELTPLQSPENSEPGDAADLLAQVVQPLANRAEYARLMRRSGSITDMLTLQGTLAGEAYNLSGYGTYIAHSSSAGLESPWEYPSSGTPGIYWRHALYSMTIAGTRGLCRVGPLPGIDNDTPNGKIPARVQKNVMLHSTQIGTDVAMLVIALNAAQTSTTTIAQVTSCQQYDIISGSIGPLIIGDWGSTNSNVYLECVDAYGSGDDLTAGRYHVRSYVVNPPPSIMSITIPFRHEVQLSGTTRIQLRCVAGNEAFTLRGMDPVNFLLGTIEHIRP